MWRRNKSIAFKWCNRLTDIIDTTLTVVYQLERVHVTNKVTRLRDMTSGSSHASPQTFHTPAHQALQLQQLDIPPAAKTKIWKLVLTRSPDPNRSISIIFLHVNVYIYIVDRRMVVAERGYPTPCKKGGEIVPNWKCLGICPVDMSRGMPESPHNKK